MSVHDIDHNSNPTCDADCTRMGWQELLINLADGTQLHISVAPQTCLEDEFKAFCHDEQEMIRVSGWHIVDTEILSS